MAVIPFPVRNKLAYPAGCAPGFNPAHPMSVGIGSRKGFSVIATNNTFLSLIDSKIWGYSGATPTAGIDGSIGPAVKHSLTTANVDNNQPTFVPTGVTCGLIFTPNTLDAQNAYIQDQSSYFFVAQSGVPNFVFGGQNHVFTGGLLVAGFPYFLAVSTDSVGNVYFVATNLKTGGFQHGWGTGFGQGLTGNLVGGFAIGGNPGTSGPVAAAMLSLNSPLTPRELIKWAQDPWAFWYPNQTQMLVAAAAASATTLYELINW